MAGIVISTTNLPGDVLSVGDAQTNPGTVETTKDDSSTPATENSTQLKLYVVVTDLGTGGVSQYDGVSLALFNEVDTGVNWKIAEDNAGSPGTFSEGPLALGDLTINGDTPFWLISEVDNDGTVPTNKYTAAEIGITYTEIA